jgi:cytochrome c-type biogenesis protein CcmH/NrfG
VTVTKRVVRLDHDALAALEEQRKFLRRSLADLEREHDAGDLEPEDYDVLRDDYTVRLSSVSRAIDDGKAELSTVSSPRSRRQNALTVAAVAVFAIVCGVVVAHSAGRRDAGATITGEISKTARDRNTECLQMASQQQNDAAVKCYTSVLADNPGNVEALTYRGWVRFTGGDAQGVSDLRQAVMLDGSYPDVHAFLAIVLFQAGCASDAKAELTRLDALNPSELINQQITQSGLRNRIDQALSAPTTTASACAAATP